MRPERVRVRGSLESVLEKIDHRSAVVAIMLGALQIL
jgi:hypothetical protein